MTDKPSNPFSPEDPRSSASETQVEIQDQNSEGMYADEFPATPEQVRFWYLDQLNPETASSNICVMWRLSGDYSIDSIQTAFTEIINRHEILRTSLIEVDGQLIQRVTPKVDFNVGKIDVRGLKKEDQASRIEKIAYELSHERFDISQPGLLRISHVQTDKAEATLIIVAHHTVFDGYSIRVLGRELGKLVSLLESGKEAALPELPLQYGDYALWRKDCEGSEGERESIEFWTQKLQSFEYFEVPSDRPRRELGKRSGKRIDIPLGDSFETELGRAAKTASLTPYTFGCGVMAAALHRATDAKSVSYGTAFAGRNASEVEDLIGVFINPLVFNFTIPDTPSFSDVIETAASDVRSILAHADLPFDKVFRCARQQRDATRTPLYSVSFSLQKVFLEEHDYGSIQIASIPSVTPEITHDLSFQIAGRSSGWLLMLDYDADRFDEATAQALGQLVKDCFYTAFSHPGTSVAKVAFHRAVPGTEDDAAKGTALLLEHRALPEDPPAAKAIPAEADNVESKDNDLHQHLRNIWCDILGVPDDKANGNFFDLGGHSVLALRLISRINADLDIQIGISDFLRDPTLKGITDFVDRLSQARSNALDTPSDDLTAARSMWNTITLADSNHTGPIIISINQPFLYNQLARQFHGLLTFVNIHIDACSVLKKDSVGLEIGRLVTGATEVIQSIAKGRPVALLGQCVDGTMAMLIAQSLKEAGTPATLLGMIDSWAPNVMDDVPFLRRKFIQTRAKLRRLSHFVRQRARDEISWTEFLSQYAVTKKILILFRRIEKPTIEEINEWKINSLLVSGMKHVDFTPYEGETLLLKTQSQTRRAENLFFGWKSLLAPDTAVFDLRGWHENALTGSEVDSLANLLRTRLARRAR